MTPSISVIMPVYNAKENELRTAIESILNQTFKDFEFIIINDGSTNNSEDIILSYKDARIKYHKNEQNLKITASLNIGLELACGKYIARIDADDYSDITRLEKQFKILEKNPRIGLAGSYVIKIPDNIKIKFPSEDKDIKLFLKYCANCIAHSAVMFRKSLLDEHNLKYNPNALHAEDYKLWCDMSEFCEFTTVPEYLLYYRNSPDGISAQNTAYQKKMSAIIILDNMIKDFGEDKKYLYTLLVKFIKNEPYCKDEFEIFEKFLFSVANTVEENISQPFKPFIKQYIYPVLKMIKVYI